MPSPIQFLKTYGLTEGSHLAPNWKVNVVTTEFHVSEMHEIYDYGPIIVRLWSSNSKSTTESATAALRKASSRQGLLCYSVYGSPYDVELSNLQVVETSRDAWGGVEVTFSLTGSARRNRGEPSRPHSKSDEERKTRAAPPAVLRVADEPNHGKADMSAAEVIKARGGFSIVEAHCNLGACPLCGDQEIMEHQLICKPNSAGYGGGGWAHCSCQVSKFDEGRAAEKAWAAELKKFGGKYFVTKALKCDRGHHCKCCRTPFVRGQLIARESAVFLAGKHGGWSHVGCLCPP